MKHIDADRLKAEIGELDNQFRTGNYYLDNSEQAVGYQNALTDICGIIDSLQQEQPEEPIPAYLEKQKPELVQQPTITYTYNSNASRDERLKAALLALLNSDLLKVKEGGYFTKQDLIEWIKMIPTDKPAEWSDDDEEMLEYVICDVNDAKQLFATKEAIDLCDKEIAWLKSLPLRCPKSSDNWKPSDHQMNILKAVKEYVGRGSGYWGEGLGSLIEDLEKLM